MKPRSAIEVASLAVKEKIPAVSEIVPETARLSADEQNIPISNSNREPLTAADIPQIVRCLIKELHEEDSWGDALNVRRAIENLRREMHNGFERIRRERIKVLIEQKSQEQTIREMGEGVEKFLAGLQTRLTSKQLELFLALIARVQDGAILRVQTYDEIGKKLGVSKQAVQKRYKELCKCHNSVGEYIQAIRVPGQSIKCSEMSPSGRRENGIDESYNSYVK